MYDIQYRGIAASRIGAMVESRPDIPAPTQRVEKITIPGRDGDFFIREPIWEDIKITVQMAFRAEAAEQWFERWRAIKRWLMGTGKLFFSEDPLYFYRVKEVEPGIAERESRKYGHFQVVFTCEPYQYGADGDVWTDLPSSGKIVNPSGLEAHPVYKIIGEGECVLTVNGYEMRGNVGQNLILDTERQIAYRTDGTVQNTMVTGDYTQLYLGPGDNTVSVAEGFTLQMQSNWRYL